MNPFFLNLINGEKWKEEDSVSWKIYLEKRKKKYLSGEHYEKKCIKFSKHWKYHGKDICLNTHFEQEREDKKKAYMLISEND